jgi:EH domain-containing protein 1
LTYVESALIDGMGEPTTSQANSSLRQSGSLLGENTIQKDVGALYNEIYLNWFRLADSGTLVVLQLVVCLFLYVTLRTLRCVLLAVDNDGRVTGPDAVVFFERSGLPREQLAKVWAFADNKRAGYLDSDSFIKALELISMFQNKGNITLSDYEERKRGGLIEPPVLEGLPTSIQAVAKEEAPFSPFYSPTDAASSPSVMKPSFGTPKTREVHYFAGPAMPLGGGGDSVQHASDAQATTPGPFSKFGLDRSMVNTMPISTSMMKKDDGAQKKQGPMTAKDVTSITDGLRKIYFEKIRPVEDMYKFGHFFSPLLNEGDFEAKPSVLLLGQYSTGKSTFVKYLLGRDYPGIHIGPEPTTDRFVVVMHGPDDRRTPGNTLVVQTDKPFTGLAQFGNGFLSKFESATCENRLLEEITLIDTPGVLSGEKQRIERSYDFKHVCGWFAARCDLVLLLFDPHKLDISDEFREVISTLKGHDDKVRIVLNKADQVDQQQLMRVYGALMWSLGKVFNSPEVCRVYIGSFNATSPIKEDINPACKSLFEKEQEDLLHDLYDVPARSCDRKVNEFVKRVRAAKIHFLIMGHLRKQMPYFGQKKAQAKLLDRLQEEFVHIQREYHVHPGDFPDVVRYREILSAFDLSKFPKLDKAVIGSIDSVLTHDIPQLVRKLGNPFSATPGHH